MTIESIKEVLGNMSRKELQSVMMATLSAMKEMANREYLDAVSSFNTGDTVKFVCGKAKSEFFGKEFVGKIKEIKVNKKIALVAVGNATWAIHPLKLQKVS